MSKITDNFDTIVTRVGIVLSSHKRLMNPYNLELNDDPLLKKGWGVKFGSMVNQGGVIGTQISFDRSIIVVITREAIARESDRATRSGTEKDLLNDQLLVIKDICNTINLIGFVGDAGIEFVFGDAKQSFLGIKTEFSDKTFESLV